MHLAANRWGGNIDREGKPSLLIIVDHNLSEGERRNTDRMEALDDGQIAQ